MRVRIIFSEEVKKHPELNDYFSHSAIGAVYNPDNDKFGNYVPSTITKRYDAFVFVNETRALHPLEMHIDPHKIPETYPFGI